MNMFINEQYWYEECTDEFYEAWMLERHSLPMFRNAWDTFHDLFSAYCGR